MPDNASKSAFQSEHDRILLVRTRECLVRSRRLLAETAPQLDPHRQCLDRNAVSITEVDNEWHVLVEQMNQHIRIRSFRDEQAAVNYAEGERVRLGIDTLTRI